MNDFAGSADQIAKQLVAGGMEPDRAMMMALRLKQEPSGPLALRSTENMSVIGKSMTPPGLPESVVSDTVGIIKNMDDASVIATASRMTGLLFDSPIQARLMLEKMFAGGASILAGVSGVGSGLPQRMTGYEVEARFPALGGQVGVGAAIPRGQGSPAININYQRQFQEGGSVLASDTDKIAEQLIAGGVDPQQAMTLALRMAQSRQQADQSILGGVPTQPPVSDVPPATEILGGDPSKLFQRQPTTMERIKDLPKDVLGAGEALVSMGSLAALAPASMLYALRPGQKTQGDPMEFALRNMYMPRSERGPSHLAGLGEVLESLPQTGPLPELQAFTGVGRGVGRQLAEKGRQAGRAMAPAAANVAEDILRRQGLLMGVVKQRDGNWISGDPNQSQNFLLGGVEAGLTQLKSPTIAGETPAQRIPRHEQLLRDPSLNEESRQTVQRMLDQEKQRAAVDNWVQRNLGNYVKKEMATPEDPVRKLMDQGITHLPREEIEAYRTTAVQNLRRKEGFPEEGMAQTALGREWENRADQAIESVSGRQGKGLIDTRIVTAGDIQKAVELMPDLQAAEREFLYVKSSIRPEAKEKFMARGLSENEASLLSAKMPINELAELVGKKEDLDVTEKNYLQLKRNLNAADWSLGVKNPWIQKLDPETKLYGADIRDLGFDHIVDVLRQDLAEGRIRPEQLNKVSMEQAVRRTYEYDQEMAKKMREAQIKATEGMPTFKEYPEQGFKWVELKSEDDPKLTESALKYEGETMGHCVGGYCPDVLEGRSRIFSLRDEKGEPHVTVEVQPVKMSQSEAASQARGEGLKGFEFAERVMNLMEGKDVPPNIVQIKGKQNRKPKDEYLPFVQDFVRSGNWSKVGDPQNAGLRRYTDVFNDAEQRKIEALNLPVPNHMWLTGEEIQTLHNAINPEGKRLKYNASGQIVGDSYKQGGSVNHKAVASARRALEKAMAKGGIAKAVGKAAAKAAKSDDEKTLPMVLQRAPAKTKQELQAEAERVGRQIIGEHVTKPGDTANLADYSKKVSERLRAMQEGQDYVLKETTPTSPLANVNPAVGSILVGLPGDISIADKKLMSFGKLKIGSQQQGGSLYGVPFMNDPEELAKFWASNYGPANIFQNKVTELGGLYPDQDILGAYMSMGRTGMNFAQHFADANLKAIRSAIKAGDVSKDDIESFNKMIREGWSKINQKTGEREYFKYPDFAGIEKTGESYAQMMLDPELRKWFNDRMKTGKETAPRGLPSGVDIEYAISEPALRNLEHSLVGYSVGKMQPGRGLISPVDHATYSHGIPGQAIGRLAGHIPARLAFSDASKVIAETKRPQDFTGTIQKVFPHQVVDQQWQDEVGQYLEYLKRITGKKKGGLAKMAGGGSVLGRAAKAGAKAAKAAKSAGTVAPKVIEPVRTKDIPEKEGALRLFHGGSDPGFEAVPQGGRFNGFFALPHEVGGHGIGHNYFADIPEEKILRNYELNYELPLNKVVDAFEKTTGIKQGDPRFQPAWQAIIEESNANENALAAKLSDDFGEAGWEAQRMRGQVAKQLGYDAIEMQDEHGRSYLITSGVPLKYIGSQNK